MFKAIKFKNVFKPVDILVPFHSNYHYLSECIESILTKTLGIIYTITIIDDASPNEKFIKDLEKKLKDIPIQYFRHYQQQGFGCALETGFRNTLNDWIVFLHADCRIEQTDWLLNMLQSMQKLKTENVKLISAKLNHGGTGAYDDKVLGSIEKRKDQITDTPLPLVCTLTHRDLWNNIGGFVKNYPYAWYEDEELFWRMKLKGFKQAVCGSTYIHHYGGTTVKELIKNHKIKEIMESNQQTYIKDIREFASKI